jgi:hypothetical protein
MYVSVYKNLSYWNQQKNVFEMHIVKRNNAKKCFMKWNKIFEAKKGFPSFRFEVKITKLKRSEAKRSENFETQRSEKMGLNFWSEQAKHM